MSTPTNASPLQSPGSALVNQFTHEVRSPLTVVSEFAALLREEASGAITSRQSEYLGTICDRVEDLSLLVNDLDDMSQIEAHVFPVRRRIAQIEQVLQEGWHAIERKALRRHLVLHRDVPVDLPTVFCDVEQVGAALVNLAAAAISSSTAEGTIRVWAEAVGSEGVRLGIASTGPALSRDMVRRITESKRRGGDPQRWEGVGLRLKTACELIALNFGEVEAPPAADGVASISFTMPSGDPGAVVAGALRNWASESVSPRSAVVATVHFDAQLCSFKCERIEPLLDDARTNDDLLLHTGSGRWLLVTCRDRSSHERLVTEIGKRWSDFRLGYPELNLRGPEIDVLGAWQVGKQDDATIECVRGKCDSIRPWGVSAS
jgi:hypothetical protein